MSKDRDYLDICQENERLREALAPFALVGHAILSEAPPEAFHIIFKSYSGQVIKIGLSEFNRAFNAMLGRLTDEDLAPYAHDAAIEWCGEKDRETFDGDIKYFLNNWRSLPGLRARVDRCARKGMDHD